MSLIRRVLDRVNDFRKTYLTGNTRDVDGEAPVATFARTLFHPITGEAVARIDDAGALAGSAVTALLSTAAATAAAASVSAIALAMPVGVVLPYAGTAAPTGWALCYGQEIAVATYPTLDALLTTTYGARTDGLGGAGSTHFRVPDLRGRVPAGQDDMGGTSANRLTAAVAQSLNGDTLGATGGEETHTLLAAEIGTSSLAGGSAVAAGTDLTDISTSEGDAAAHNNVQPTIILNYIIKLT